jgi:predicted metal-dependent peptidase
MARTYELTEAIATLIHKHPFFAVLLLDLLEIVETESLPTAATDGKALMVNPEYFKKKLRTVDERVFVLAHEILHVIMHHPTRLKYYMDLGVGPDLKTFSKGKANHAMDYVINDTLIHDNVGKCPIGALVNPQFDRTMIWDEVYEQLPDEDDNDDSMDREILATLQARRRFSVLFSQRQLRPRRRARCPARCNGWSMRSATRRYRGRSISARR